MDCGGVVAESVFTYAFAKLENTTSAHTISRFNILALQRKYVRLIKYLFLLRQWPQHRLSAIDAQYLPAHVSRMR